MVSRAEGWKFYFLTFMGARAMAWPPDQILYVGEFPSQIIINHELVHLMQYRRDGYLVYLFRWWYQLLTKGYSQIDYEREANGEILDKDDDGV